jgi:hypothetical protein
MRVPRCAADVVDRTGSSVGRSEWPVGVRFVAVSQFVVQLTTERGTLLRSKAGVERGALETDDMAVLVQPPRLGAPADERE